MPHNGLEKLEVLLIQNTHTLKTIPSVYAFKVSVVPFSLRSRRNFRWENVRNEQVGCNFCGKFVWFHFYIDNFLFTFFFIPQEFTLCLAYTSVPLLCFQISPETWSVPARSAREIFGWIAWKMHEQWTENGYESKTRRKLCKFINFTHTHIYTFTYVQNHHHPCKNLGCIFDGESIDPCKSWCQTWSYIILLWISLWTSEIVKYMNIVNIWMNNSPRNLILASESQTIYSIRLQHSEWTCCCELEMFSLQENLESIESFRQHNGSVDAIEPSNSTHTLLFKRSTDDLDDSFYKYIPSNCVIRIFCHFLCCNYREKLN